MPSAHRLRYSDIVANFLLYTPFGFFAGLTIRGGRLARLFVVLSAGVVLCTGVELAKYYDAGRITNMSDVYLNSMGTAAGAVAAIWLYGSDIRPRSMAAAADNPILLLLLIAMLGYHLPLCTNDRVFANTCMPCGRWLLPPSRLPPTCCAMPPYG